MDSTTSPGGDPPRARLVARTNTPRRQRFEPPVDATLSSTDEEDYSSDLNGDHADRPVADHRGQRRPRPYMRPPRMRSTRGPTTAVLVSVRLLRQVEALRRRRDELVALHVARLLNTDRQDHLVTTVLQYFDTFSNGYSTARVHAIFQFLNTHVDKAVFQYGTTGLGIDAWIEQWRRYTKLFPSIAVRLSGTTCSFLLEPGDVHTITDAATTTCLIEARGWMGGVISPEAIAAVFPHLLNRADLVSKLVGQPLTCPVDVRFYFNSAGRVIRVDLDADFVQGVHNIANVNVVDLAQIMERAEIGDNSMLPDTPWEE